MDARSYTERALQKLIKAKGKADRRAARGQASSSGQVVAASVPVSANPSAASSTTNLGDGTSSSAIDGAAGSSAVDIPPVPSADAVPPVPASGADAGDAPAPAPVAPVQTRTQMLRERQDVVLRFMRLVVPVLIEVYNASVLLNVRTKV